MGIKMNKEAGLSENAKTPKSLTFYGQELGSRLLLGTAQYPSPQVLLDAINASAAEVITVSVRRESGSDKAGQHYLSKVTARYCQTQLVVRVLKKRSPRL